MKSEIITVSKRPSIKNELNINSQFLLDELCSLGINVCCQTTVENNLERLKQTVSFALQNSSLVILTGELNLDYDHFKKDIIALAFQSTNHCITSATHDQTSINDSTVFYNENNIAIGFSFKVKNSAVILLPGYVNEIAYIFRKSIIPYINNLFKETTLSKNIHSYGIDVPNLQTALVKTAIQKNKKIAVAESCTGGLIASQIVSVPGSSECFEMGIVCYSNEVKHKLLQIEMPILNKFGAVSETVAKQMAYQIRKISGAHVGISTTGIAGPDGGSKEKPIGLVYIGISTKNATNVYKLPLPKESPKDRQYIRNLATSFAINKARLALNLL